MSSEQPAFTDAERIQLIVGISEAFSPSAPIDKTALFAGRSSQINDVISAVFQRGQHVIIFGERGVGKTSLANVLFDFLSKAGVKSLESGTINCDKTMDFSSLWHKIFRDLAINKDNAKAGFTNVSASEAIPVDHFMPQIVTPDDVRHALKLIPAKTMIIIDELDRLKNAEATTLLADTVKTLSDHSVDTTLILVGVADSINGLIAEHASVERNLVQIHMPRMSTDELHEIIDKALTQVQMTIESDAKDQISSLSKGLPHYTHLLGKHAALSAVKGNRKHIVFNDVFEAIGEALRHAQQSIVSAYHKATISPRENLYKQVLLSCALAKTDFLGFFSAADVRDPMTLIMGKRYDIPAFSQHLNSFCDDDRGPVLQRTGTARKFRFRFVNPLLQPFVILKGLSDGVVTIEQLNAYFALPAVA
jgi:ABC-type cobalamin/Fe3+-siderophores transport system ATPase subunit